MKPLVGKLAQDGLERTDDSCGEGLTGRAGAAMAAEIASMRISEQIDALEVMAIDPIEYLVVPRVVAGLFMMPLLSVCFSIVASGAAAAKRMAKKVADALYVEGGA